MTLILSAVWLSDTAISQTAPPIPAAQIHILSGDIRGITEDGLTIYRGLLYAAPPVGDLRWREPQPAKAWPGVWDAGEFKRPASRKFHDWNRQEATGNKEDCLYLNVWSPGWSNKAK